MSGSDNREEERLEAYADHELLLVNEVVFEKGI
jgi:hypothetical protein